MTFQEPTAPRSIREAQHKIDELWQLGAMCRKAIEKHGEQPGYIQNLRIYIYEIRFYTEWIKERRGR